MSAGLETKRDTRTGVQGHVLLVDDDDWVRHVLSDKLTAAHYAVETAADAKSALDAARVTDFDVILLDVSLPDMPGLETLRRLKGAEINASVIMISGQEDVPGVVEAMKLGALDYLLKPLHAERVLTTVGVAARAGRLERENRRLLRRLQELQGTGVLVGCSPPLRRLTSVLSRAAEGEATLLVEGRPGSGKTLAAQLVHAGSRRSNRPLTVVLGEATTQEALEASLREGERGTLLIEDVDALCPAAQARLVRHLKERNPGSGMASSGPDVRLIAATSARLPELVARGKFREDLFYRLNVFPVVVPSLQERRDDIALLATHFLKLSAENSGLAAKGFTAAAMILLETHPWPGNIAQLQNAIFRAHAIAGGGPIDRAHLLGPMTGITAEAVAPTTLPEGDADDETVREEDVLPLETEEKRSLARALKATKGNVRRAAQLLRIGRATLYRKIQVYKLKLN
jgi:DNA-binding NtrC family response regulator